MSKDKFFDVDLDTMSTLFHRRKTEGMQLAVVWGLRIGRPNILMVHTTSGLYRLRLFNVGSSPSADAPAPKYESFSLMGMLGDEGDADDGSANKGFQFLNDSMSDSGASVDDTDADDDGDVCCDQLRV